MENFFWEKLLNWFNGNKRNYPWRNTNNPFHILIAEILLQQTNVRKVEEIYKMLILKYPDSESIMQASFEEIKNIIKPLGLNYRAARIKKCAEIIVSEYNGNVPENKNELEMFPGVGDYISEAVLCYAYNKKTIPIDTNVIRVFIRYFGFKSQKNRPRTDIKLLNNIREKYNYFQKTKIPNLAVLDFASLVCTANKPKCTECIMSEKCNYNIKKRSLKQNI